MADAVQAATIPYLRRCTNNNTIEIGKKQV